MDLQQQLHRVMNAMGVENSLYGSGDLTSYSPIDGSALGSARLTSTEQMESVVASSQKAFVAWRAVPAPKRGELIRLFGNLLREHKEALGTLVTLECGKIKQEGLGEVQEMIDICDFAVGLSRQLYGLTIASERPGHKMLETWHPIGPIGIISAFNFPVAVWAWNTALAIVCGNPTIWKPSEKTPLTALACQHLFEQACHQFGDAPNKLSQVVYGKADIGNILVEDTRIPVISATGSCAMGKIVGPKVAARFGKSILELGGNNAIIVCPSADLDMAIRAIVFGAVGTAGQRCTSTRRLIVHEAIADEVKNRLLKAYQSIAVGDPLASTSLVGPLIDQQALTAMQTALQKAKQADAEVFGGERVHLNGTDKAYYVKPAIVDIRQCNLDIKEETFAPILYLNDYSDLTDAIAQHNNVPQGLSSAIFTNDLREAETFLSVAGSDCGIANVNIGTSGAEIGGAFGGEKATGGGRESGSDAWKNYMRRSTSTINYSRELPLAQGIKFES
jgi:aldehyde dehydrogenase (NAD+)